MLVIKKGLHKIELLTNSNVITALLFWEKTKNNYDTNLNHKLIVIINNFGEPYKCSLPKKTKI